MLKETIQQFSNKIGILEEILQTDYFIEDVGVIKFPLGNTDWGCYNVSTYDGSNGEVKWDNETKEYYMTQSPIDLILTGDEDEVINYNIESEDDVLEKYLKEEDYTVVWIHEVKTGTLSLSTTTMTVIGDTNSDYDTPSAYVIIDNKSYPLEINRKSQP